MADFAPHYETTACLCLAARRAARVITREFDQALRGHGLRATQFTLLAALNVAGPLTIGALADTLAADRTTITRNLKPVEKRGLVTLHTAPDDARSRIVTLTTEGNTLLTAALESWRRTQQALTGTLGHDAADGLRRLAGGPCTLPPDEQQPEPRTAP